MIQFVLLQNRQGKTRLSKWYSPYENPEKRSIEREIHQLVVNRDSKFTNFIEYRTFRLVYRRYAGLYFTFCIDISDNQFAYLEAIHFFVELLDKYFGNVCELDLVFNFYKVYAIIDEFVLAGELQETNKNTILGRMGELEKFE